MFIWQKGILPLPIKALGTKAEHHKHEACENQLAALFLKEFAQFRTHFFLSEWATLESESCWAKEGSPQHQRLTSWQAEAQIIPSEPTAGIVDGFGR